MTKKKKEPLTYGEMEKKFDRMKVRHRTQRESLLHATTTLERERALLAKVLAYASHPFDEANTVCDSCGHDTDEHNYEAKLCQRCNFPKRHIIHQIDFSKGAKCL